MSSSSVLILAGLLVWLIAGIRVVGAWWRLGFTADVVVNLAAWVLFIAAFALHLFAGSGRYKQARVLFALTAQSLCAIVLANAAGGTGMEIALLVMVAGQLPGAMSMTASLLWVVVQTAAILIAQVTSDSPPSWVSAAVFLGSYLAFQLFALGAASLAESESQAREALAAANRELERLHGLALESARHAERLRIARDLHDSLGHRLTALGFALEAARHVPAAEVQHQVAKAREMASALMDDLREAVGEIRDNEAPELRSLLEGLSRSVESPRVSVEIAEGLRITNAETVTALFRISQEIVTNAAKHSKARTLRLTLQPRDQWMELEGRDDGGAPASSPAGHGLTGIRERSRLLGGDAEWGPMAEGGFRVLVRIPFNRLS